MPLKQLPTLPISVTPLHGFDLDTAMARAGAIGGAPFLGHDTFESEPHGGVQEPLRILKALRIADVDAIRSTEQIGELRFALLRSFRP